MTAESLITCDPKILNGTPVFKGTRVPIRTLFDFLESFPSVNRKLATDVLRLHPT
jgi:hypothetical protein